MALAEPQSLVPSGWRPRVRAAVLLGPLLGLYLALLDLLGGFQPRGAALGCDLATGVVWAALVLGLLAFGDRFPVPAARRWPPLLANLGAALFLAGAGLAAAWGLAAALGLEGPAERARAQVHPLVLGFLAVALARHLAGARPGQQGELEQARMEASLARAKSQALLQRLQPHFLFNALNSVSALIRPDPEGAENMLALLAGLLRKTLDTGSAPLIPLRQELDLVEAYLAIEQVRMGRRLRAELDLPEGLGRALVPQFLLQPLVENSLKHGLGPKVDGGRITVRARREGTTLLLEVEDDGVGCAGVQDGLGLASVRGRLELMYPGRHTLGLTTGPDQGTLVQIRLPLA